MDSWSFNSDSRMPFVNEKWASHVLQMSHNLGRGVDLYDGGKIVEVKFHMPVRPPKKKRTVCWKGLEHQVNYGKETGMPFYFLLGKYWMDRDVEEIAYETPIACYEKMVIRREAWLVRFNWFAKYLTYREIGETEKSKWDNRLKFTYEKDLPRTYKSFNV